MKNASSFQLPALSLLKVKVKSLSHVRLFVTPWTAAHQAPRSMEFSRQEYWSGVPLPSPLSFLGCGCCLHCPKWLPWTSYHTHIPGSRAEKERGKDDGPSTPALRLLQECLLPLLFSVTQGKLFSMSEPQL